MKKRWKQKIYRYNQRCKKEFYDCVKDIAEHPVVLRMKLYPHHGNSSCYDHCIHVAYLNYKW
ncbi:MAG: phosphohydrolase, partial [Lachnospiraceae bacterium]